jgi:uncharacterized protein (TIGR02145 family)
MGSFYRYRLLCLILVLTIVISRCRKDASSADAYTGTWSFTIMSSTYAIAPWGYDLRSADTSSAEGSITAENDNVAFTINAGSMVINGILNEDGSFLCYAPNNFNGSGLFEDYCLINLSMSRIGNSYRSFIRITGEKPVKADRLKRSPSVRTDEATAVSIAGATLNGTVKANFLPTDIYFDYGTSADYGSTVKAMSALYSGTREVQANSVVSSLALNTVYHFRVKAVNSMGTTLGKDMTFTTGSTNATVTDIDGNVYPTVRIGNQVWMAENLKVTRYADGAPIELVKNQDAWDISSGTKKIFCYYNNDTVNFNIYGALYNWYAAVNGSAGSSSVPSGIRGACPAGWHIPGEEEWNVLETYLGSGGTAGSKLTETGNEHWLGSNSGATNITGFTALPGGRRTSYPYGFVELGTRADFWTATPYPTYDRVYFRFISGQLISTFRDKTDGLSIRCVKD